MCRAGAGDNSILPQDTWGNNFTNKAVMSQFEIPFPVASLALFSGPCNSSGVEGTVVPLIPGCAKRDPIRTNLRGLGWSTGGKSLTLCWLPRHHLEHTTFPPVDSHPLHGVVARPRGTRRPGDRQEIAITGSCGNARSRPRRCGRWSSSATGPRPPPAPPATGRSFRPTDPPPPSTPRPSSCGSASAGRSTGSSPGGSRITTWPRIVTTTRSRDSSDGSRGGSPSSGHRK